MNPDSVIVAPGIGEAFTNFWPFIIPFLASAIAEPAFELWQNAWKALNNAPAVVKRILAPTITYWLNWAGLFFGAWITNVDPANLTVAQISNMAAAILVFLHHKASQEKRLANGGR